MVQIITERGVVEGLYKLPRLFSHGFRLIINARDERGHTPHVHVVKARTKVVISLDASFRPYKIKGMSRPDVARARELVAEHLDQLMEWWTEFNG
jgi:protein tyrosine phosphatase (PTP) superfamily phosphohydrolase (DUF442 family)